MAKFTLLLKNDKELIISTYAKIRQRESNVDTLQVLLPLKYDEIDLSLYTVTMEWVSPANIAYADLLVRDEDIYKEDYYRYTLPVTSQFTEMAGTVEIKITATYYDETTDTKHVLHTNSVQTEIMTWDDFFRYTPSSQIATIDEKMLEIDNKIAQLRAVAAEIDLDMPIDLQLTDDLLQLKNSQGPVGDGVEILTNIEDPDKEHDGEADLDEIEAETGISELDLDSLVS